LDDHVLTLALDKYIEQIGNWNVCGRLGRRRRCRIVPVLRKSGHHAGIAGLRGKIVALLGIIIC